MANPQIPPTQFYYTTGPQPGFDLSNYLVINGGGNVYQVREGSGPANGDRPGLQTRIFPTLISAVLQCRANRGDVIQVLEGSVTNIGATNYLAGCPDGVTIIGQGFGASQAQINFTAAASNLGTTGGNLAANNVVIAGFNMNMNATAATLVAAPFSVTGADCAFVGNRVTFSTSATQQATAPFTVGAGANRFIMDRVQFYGSDGTFATNPTQGILVSSAVSGFVLSNSRLTMACNTTGAGVLQFSAAATDALVLNNVMTQNKAASTAALVGFAGATGYIHNNLLGIQAATGGATAIATIGSFVLGQNWGTALGGAGHTAILIGTPSS